MRPSALALTTVAALTTQIWDQAAAKTGPVESSRPLTGLQPASQPQASSWGTHSARPAAPEVWAVQPSSFASGSQRQVVQPQTLSTVWVTNRTARTVVIELVGQTAQITLAPGQSRQLQVAPPDLSLLYWDPNQGGNLTAEVRQTSASGLEVDLLPSTFPGSTLAMALPEPGNPNVLQVF